MYEKAKVSLTGYNPLLFIKEVFIMSIKEKIKEKIISFIEESSCYGPGTIEYLNTGELADAIFQNEAELVADEKRIKISSSYVIERIADEMLANGEIKSVKSSYDGLHILVIPGSSKDIDCGN